MKKSLTLQFVIITAAFFLLCSIVIGCSSEAKLETEISGTWSRAEGNGTVNINLANELKSLVIDGHFYKAVVEKIDMGSYTTFVKVEIETGKTEVWSIQQVWDDNGSAFKLAFRHNGTQETLVPVGQS